MEKAKDANIVGILVGTLGVGKLPRGIELSLCMGLHCFANSAPFPLQEFM